MSSGIKDVIPLLFRSGGIYFDKNKQILETQIRTLEKINDNCYEEYKGMLDEVKDIRAANDETYGLISAIGAYSEKITELSKQIDQMEKEEEAMEQHITKLETKFRELDTIKKYIGQVKKPVV